MRSKAIVSTVFGVGIVVSGLVGAGIAATAWAQQGQQGAAPAGQPGVVAEGKAPPALTLESLGQAPENAVATWDALKGKVVVLEFWATWCGPCVKAFPHLNELADHYKDKPVVFIAITDEPTTKVEPFLKKRPLKTWIGYDTDQSMFQSYGIEYIPRTFVVAPDGTVAHVTQPDKVTTELLDKLVAKATTATPGATGGAPAR